MTADQRIVRAGRWHWKDGHRSDEEPEGRPSKPAGIGRALAHALAETTRDTGAGRRIDLFLDAGNANAAALARFAEAVESGRRIRPSFATALEPTQIAVEALSELGWAGQVVATVSDASSAPLLPVAMAVPGDWSCPHRVVAEIRATSDSTPKEFSGSIAAVLIRPAAAGTGARAADAGRFTSVGRLLSAGPDVPEQVEG